MTASRHDRATGGHGLTAPSTVIWNTVVPALAVVLVLGAPLAPALLAAAAISIVITAVVRLGAHGGTATWAPAHATEHRL